MDLIANLSKPAVLRSLESFFSRYSDFLEISDKNSFKKAVNQTTEDLDSDDYPEDEYNQENSQQKQEYELTQAELDKLQQQKEEQKARKNKKKRERKKNNKKQKLAELQDVKNVQNGDNSTQEETQDSTPLKEKCESLEEQQTNSEQQKLNLKKKRKNKKKGQANKSPKSVNLEDSEEQVQQQLDENLETQESLNVQKRKNSHSKYFDLKKYQSVNISESKHKEFQDQEEEENEEQLKKEEVIGEDQKDKNLQVENKNQNQVLREPFFHRYKIKFNNPNKCRKSSGSKKSNGKSSSSSSSSSSKKGQENNLKVPYVPEIKPGFEYTLVLDLDKTLIYSDQLDVKQNMDSYKTYFRPGLIEFLREMSQIFEIIAFTAAEQDYATKILNYIDPKNEFFTHRLYKQHLKTKQVVKGGQTIKENYKDLQCLGRDLRQVIIIDDIDTNFKLQPYNGVKIPAWCYDNPEDICLSELTDYLKLVIREKYSIDKKHNIGLKTIFAIQQTQQEKKE